MPERRASAERGRPAFFCRWRIGLAECGSRAALPPASFRSRRGSHPRTALGRASKRRLAKELVARRIGEE